MSCIVPECHTASQDKRFVCTQLFPPGENGGAPIKQRQTQGARLNPVHAQDRKKTAPALRILGIDSLNKLNTSLITFHKELNCAHTFNRCINVKKTQVGPSGFQLRLQSPVGREQNGEIITSIHCQYLWILTNISTEASKGGLPEHCFHHYCLHVRVKNLPMHLYITCTIKPQKKGAYCHDRVHVYQNVLAFLGSRWRTRFELWITSRCVEDIVSASYHRNVNRSGLPIGHVGWCCAPIMHHCALCNDLFHSE